MASLEQRSGHKQTSLLRGSLYAGGTIIFAACIGFLVVSIHRNWQALRSADFAEPSFVLLSVGLYIVCHFSTGMSWPFALKGLGTPIPLRTGFLISLVAQVGKYLPGNVAQYFGRATLAADAGVSIKLSGISTALEIVSAILAAAIVAVSALAIEPASFGRIVTFVPAPSVANIVPAVGLLAVVVAVVIYMRRNEIGSAAVLYPTLFLVISFLLSGSSFAALLWAFGVETLPYASIMLTFTLAWLAGFLTPGAPAGLGVREAILIGFVAPHVGAGIAIACALTHRTVTAIIDLLAACAGYAAWIRSKKKKSANDVLSGSATSHG